MAGFKRTGGNKRAATALGLRRTDIAAPLGLRRRMSLTLSLVAVVFAAQGAVESGGQEAVGQSAPVPGTATSVRTMP